MQNGGGCGNGNRGGRGTFEFEAVATRVCSSSIGSSGNGRICNSCCLLAAAAAAAAALLLLCAAVAAQRDTKHRPLFKPDFGSKTFKCLVFNVLHPRVYSSSPPPPPPPPAAAAVCVIVIRAVVLHHHHPSQVANTSSKTKSRQSHANRKLASRCCSPSNVGALAAGRLSTPVAVGATCYAPRQLKSAPRKWCKKERLNLQQIVTTAEMRDVFRIACTMLTLCCSASLAFQGEFAGFSDPFASRRLAG